MTDALDKKLKDQEVNVPKDYDLLCDLIHIETESLDMAIEDLDLAQKALSKAASQYERARMTYRKLVDANEYYKARLQMLVRLREGAAQMEALSEGTSPEAVEENLALKIADELKSNARQVLIKGQTGDEASYTMNWARDEGN